ncbi:c-type cytochrome biogenesis protein CcmI [Ramlibacter albus]|uniref:C-type cytochrome biogenesis protein CcmI n=1 Tax=Ramlibacter albus TaxID=2079448 RepID=A0A923M4Y5_9BURK|nr:c-type cytochrome biogenesis protein CcmI [Ramlibacter albus]MBC5764040.1 c-type cytochrome biogenesis protein CcmI [Ramlibacter albus]
MNLAFWSTVALLLAGALLFVLPPLMRTGGRASLGAAPIDVYRDLRAQLDAERDAGKLATEEHARAVTELEGRVIEEVVQAPEEAVTVTPRHALAALLAVALLLPAGALGIYGLIGKPGALDPAAAQARAGGGAPHTMSREEMEEMVERLAEKLQKSPDDADGWHMLARSYVAFNRLAEAGQAFERGMKLAPRNAPLLADYADTLAMLNGRNLEGRPMELVNLALQADPTHPKALSLAGTAAFNRRDFALAAATWQKLLDTLPADSDQARSVASSIAQAQQAASTQTAPAQASAPSGAAQIDGTVDVAPAIKARIPRGATLFVFARAVDGPRMPLAIVKVPVGEMPYKFRLDDASAMAAQFKLSGQREVMLGARISASGNATPQSGDLMGTLGPVKVGARDVKLAIDGVVP